MLSPRQPRPIVASSLRAAKRGDMILDTLHRRSLEKLVAQQSISGLTDADLHSPWLAPVHSWPDSVVDLARLKRKYIISPLSNGNVVL
jgi:2-haloacid dehalogenase